MTKFSGTKACVFDAYGTLFDIHAPTASISSELGDDADAISNLWRMKQLHYTWLRSLMGTSTELWQVTGDALDHALEFHGVSDSAIRAKLMDLYMKLDAYPDAVAALDRLKSSGYATAILSNGSPDMLNAAVTSAGLAPKLDEVISVHDLGVYKPDMRVYQLVLDRLGVTKDQVCFVSSNGCDAWAASHFGFRVAWINRFEQAPERLPGGPTAVIDSLADLAETVIAAG